MHLLTDEEKRLVNRYYTLSRLIGPSIAAALVLPFVWCGLVAINEVFLDGQSTGFLPLYVTMALDGVLVAVFGYSTISVSMGVRREEWQLILQKIERQSYTNQALDSRFRMPIGPRKPLTPESLGVQPGRARMLRLLIWLLPLVVLVGSMLPEFQHSREEKAMQIVLVTDTQKRIEDAFTAADYRCSGDDPQDGYRQYMMNCQPNEDLGDDRYIYLQIDRSGKIDSISYHIAVDTSITLEENCLQFSAVVQEMSGILQRAAVPYEESALAHQTEIPRELIDLTVDAGDEESSFETLERENISLSLSFNRPDSGLEGAYLYFSVRT